MPTQKIKSSKAGRQDLINQNTLSILELIQYLTTCFGDKFLMHFQDFSCTGFKYPVVNNFLASNNLPKEIEKTKLFKDNYIELRFFCNTDILISTVNSKKFNSFLNTKFNSPVFITTPYSDKKSDEKAFVIKPKFEIKIKFNRTNKKISFKNYSEISSVYEIIKDFTRKIFLQKKSLEKKHKELILKKISIRKNMYKAIKTCKKHMNRGDCYLINIANTITISKNKKFISSIDFFNSWEVLRPRYGIYYKDKNKGIACFSPERFIACKNKVIISEPIKGTLKIENKSAKIDDAKIIWNNKKEIYEHTLVVDLLRNDLNYVCQPGSVKVFLPFFARISGKLIQMQSSIIGKLANNNSLASCLEKMLPAGSISGTPKKKACELIANYEDLPRGYYTGISGILEKNGDFDIAILIRSLYMGKRGVYIGVGSGITTLSEIKMELKELEIKLKSFSRIFQGIL